jgi:glycosyltransferase involved in cell wall biosynthesis
VIVNARAVAEDAQKFHPKMHACIFPLPFSAAPQLSWLELPESADIFTRYELHRPYFIVSNQFWKHKDHTTLFRAFAQVANNFPLLELVCTGSTDDYRDPTYFHSLMALLDDAQLRGRVHILGMIPKRDQISLLKNALALVQPTLFEGGPGGGAVFDALSLGVPCIVSDIPVNRELDGEGVQFFQANDPKSLSEKLAEFLVGEVRPKLENHVLIEAGRNRRSRCGEVLISAIDAACRVPA